MRTDMIKLQWDGEQGKLRFTPEWNDADWVVKADMLVDCIAELRELYESMLTKQETEDVPRS